MLERYGHGGDLRTAAEAFGRPEGQFLDFSSNMNPLGPPAVVGELLQTAAADIVRYPDPAVRELRCRLARKYGISAECILVGNGAAELIDLAVRELRPTVTGVARPSFSEYEEAVRKAGGALYDIPLQAGQQFALGEAEAFEALERCDALFLGHPNNPTGRMIESALLERLADAGKPLIVDEAFMDFVPDEAERSLLRRAAAAEHVLVVRSMTKFYAIPGIRLGFVVGHPRRIRRLAALQVPWSVNYLAQRIGASVLDDADFERRSHEWLEAEKPRLLEGLQGLGLIAFESDVNFILLAFPEEWGMDVQEAQRRMGRQGILIRDASLFPGLDGRYARVAVRGREDNERLLAGLAHMLEELRAERGVRDGAGR
ncbi:threonine-phosphate decarboxylase [Paenibacillus athensensis]|uniref:threonine-phosphate decarboxylase n=1 Tax=Paenibacillus athensensis TaxID=1967502 RepID=A0A4Y8PSN6_9BACL|nr:threonine-phosphate decarboxylase CobD [Paenibacillus athensensis]MCD1262009.1 threonine-phosphate decarboxylase [Paenibacillus athensensis]